MLKLRKLTVCLIINWYTKKQGETGVKSSLETGYFKSKHFCDLGQNQGTFLKSPKTVPTIEETHILLFCSIYPNTITAFRAELAMSLYFFSSRGLF